MRLAVPVLALAMSVQAFAQNAVPQAPGTPNIPPNPQEPVTFEDTVVVSASRAEEALVNAPATVSVVTSQTIQNSPSVNIGDLLRVVPGVNVTQVSARDVNITTRGATSTLATSQLALVDGRSIYLDFFGLVMWDLVPTNPNDIKQIEVIRGPASAVWGANALSGVVNVITRSPREAAGMRGASALSITAGSFDRNVTGRTASAGSLFSINASHAQAVDDRWSYRVSAGFTAQDALPRPTGSLPSGTPYPSFSNSGTRQPKFDGRLDYDMTDGAKVTVAGGVAGTEGIIHTGIGPFDVDRGSRLGYATVRYQKAGRRVAFFTNLLHGEAGNLLIVGPDRRPIRLDFDTRTFDFEAGDVKAIGTRHALSYGGNFRRNIFDISLAPNGEDRSEGGAFVQDEIFLNDQFRWIVGGRLDKFSSIGDAVFSPRTTFMFKPTGDQTIRLSLNRAFRAPSLINNHLETTVVSQVTLPVVGAYAFPTRAVGDPNLKQETLTAVELGYSATIGGRALLSAAVYWNTTDDAIYFTPVAAYSSTSPPPGWPLPPQFVPSNLLTSRFTYVNLGTVKDKGVELGVDATVNSALSVFANYSYQWKPVVDFPAPFTANDINWAAPNRFNAGVNVNYGRYLGNLAVNFTDEAFWQDVLDARFAGTTDSYTLVNAGVGVKWAGDRIVTSLKVTNLGNQEVKQHIFGDVIKRQVFGEVRFAF
ncbi:MAG: TonB-dependent receptor [Vicinamibacterales bacterium]